ncbi:hypothetical protein B0G57_101379 [Trinickia symbiotica]|uniref:Secreted protein n=1 Tax=Trinickia symbiotica TaxID=863227 RepID=A0A2N7X863_9BURK|nr:hypothetical protein [Trinickia symbiotica]PMS37949.1 hypothetical protein C0Z20_03800 [Trinickia symbiotica]PPK47414.1 hypothetical protein B0G57_101379 [Trinickia symbiotica]
MRTRCRALIAGACLAWGGYALAAGSDTVDPRAAHGGYDYPTQGRVEYVLTCMDDNGHDFANVYKCSCVIDKIAAVIPYDEFVDESTFAKYAALGGEGGAEFRTDTARHQTKSFKTLQADAYRACGLPQR